MTAEEWSIDNPEYSFYEEEISQGMLDEIMKFANDYLNSQRETIFKEELEEKFPNVRGQADKYQQSTANKMGIERRAFEAGAKWLIQYLKK